MNQELIKRLKFVEEDFAGELEIWTDPSTGKYYHVPLVVERDWENMEMLHEDKETRQRMISEEDVRMCATTPLSGKQIEAVIQAVEENEWLSQAINECIVEAIEEITDIT